MRANQLDQPIFSAWPWVIAALVGLLVPACGGTNSIEMDAGLDVGASPDAAEPDMGLRPPCARMVPLRLWVTDPSAVAMLYRLETCDGESMTLVPGDGESVFDYYSLTENGQSLSSEAVPFIEHSLGQRAYVSLLLDYSSSTQAVSDDLLDSVQRFVEALLESSPRVWIGLELFDGRTAPVTVQLPTPDLAELTAAVQRVRDGDVGAGPDPGSTNLNGAIALAVPALQQRQEEVIAHNRGGVVTSGFVVVFTDGRDTANLVTLSSAADAVAVGREARGVDGEQANVQTYAVALRGTDFTANARASLLEILGGDARWLKEGTRDELGEQFESLAATIAGHAEATHLLKYCSASRSGTREVRFGVLPTRGEVQEPIVFGFDSDGFAGGCAAFFASVCEGKQCGGFNCGGCDERSEVCTSADHCENECLERDACTGQSITNDLGYVLVCDPAQLGVAIALCASACVDTEHDPLHCGACGVACPTGVSCVGGACACPNGTTLCDGACRPASYFTSTSDCGACGAMCPSGVPCTDEACACPSGTTVCNGACRSAAYFETTDACGSCGNVCTASESCVGGVCACAAGTTSCDDACRPASYFTSTSDCGACGVTCSGGLPCTSGVCACPSGTTLCNGACRAASYFTSTSNCGNCGNVCAASESCVGGTCACAAGTTWCDDECRAASYFTSTSDCGACGVTCSGGLPCTSGVCACPSGATLCNGACRAASYFTSTSNCGGCGNVCEAEQVCSGGQCQNVVCENGQCGDTCIPVKTRDVSLTTASENVGVHAIDVTHDGHVDIVAVHQAPQSVYIYPGNGAGGFGTVISLANVGRSHGDAAFGDFTGDGRTDIVVSQPDSSSIRLIRRTASGFMLDTAIAQTGTPRSLQALDYDHDGDLDLLLYLAASQCFVVRLGDGVGGFGAAGGCVLTPGSSDYNPYRIAVLDWDGDGYGDIAEAHTTADVRVWRTTGTGVTLLTSVPYPGGVYALQALDLGGQFTLAILGPDKNGPVTFLGADAQGNAVPRCEGTALAAPLTTPVGNIQGHASFVGDFDEDGTPERIWRLPLVATGVSYIHVGLP